MNGFHCISPPWKERILYYCFSGEKNVFWMKGILLECLSRRLLSVVLGSWVVSLMSLILSLLSASDETFETTASIWGLLYLPSSIAFCQFLLRSSWELLPLIGVRVDCIVLLTYTSFHVKHAHPALLSYWYSWFTVNRLLKRCWCSSRRLSVVNKFS